MKYIIKKFMDNHSEVKFRMNILSTHFIAINRQISEAVKINRYKGPYLLSSKSEYKRSSLPSITTTEKKTPWNLSYGRKEVVKILKKDSKKLKFT